LSAGEDWSAAEVEATVADYFAMLRLELAGRPYNKTEHRASLLHSLSGRTDAAVEFKHANISAVLREMNLPIIKGYQPRGNYQKSLADATYTFLEGNPSLLPHLAESEALVTASSETRLKRPEDILDDPPVRTPAGLMAEVGRERRYVGRKRDLALLDARRRALGEQGELFVVWFEQQRLDSVGLSKLAKKVERVSETEGDGTGFDIRSYERDGRERNIEVKTTTFGKFHPFVVSINEVEFSNDFSSSYYLYRLFHFGTTDRLFMLQGSLRDTCNLEAVQFRASF
jgi:hypothetical protein